MREFLARWGRLYRYWQAFWRGRRVAWQLYRRYGEW